MQYFSDEKSHFIHILVNGILVHEWLRGSFNNEVQFSSEKIPGMIFWITFWFLLFGLPFFLFMTKDEMSNRVQYTRFRRNMRNKC